jgi:hypothetical protein
MGVSDRGGRGGDCMADNAVIQFPVPKIERYSINYNPVTHEVEIPLVPDEPLDACIILGVFMDQLLEEGTLDMTDLETTFEGVKLAQQT